MSYEQTKKQRIITNRQKENIQISPHKTLLEQFYEKGWLEYKSSPYSSDARLRIGLKLIYNYQIIKRANIHSGYIFNSKIDTSISLSNAMYNDAVNYYRRCLRAVPTEFWEVVRSICLEEKMPKVASRMSERQQAYINYLYRIDLCRGLDRLISYTTKN